MTENTKKPEMSILEKIEKQIKYFTIWSLAISFLLLIITFFIKVPIWVYLTACCLITSTSLGGTFYVTVPELLITEKKNHQLIIDFFGHILPFIFVIVTFKYLSKNTYDTNNNFIYSAIFTILFVVIYNAIISANDIYNKDITYVSIIMILIYIASYSLYYRKYTTR